MNIIEKPWKTFSFFLQKTKTCHCCFWVTFTCISGDHQLFVRYLGGAEVWTPTGAQIICHVKNWLSLERPFAVLLCRLLLEPPSVFQTQQMQSCRQCCFLSSLRHGCISKILRWITVDCVSLKQLSMVIIGDPSIQILKVWKTHARWPICAWSSHIQFWSCDLCSACCVKRTFYANCDTFQFLSSG